MEPESTSSTLPLATSTPTPNSVFSSPSPGAKSPLYFTYENGHNGVNGSNGSGDAEGDEEVNREDMKKASTNVYERYIRNLKGTTIHSVRLQCISESHPSEKKTM